MAEPHLLHLAIEHRELVGAVRALAEQGHNVGNGAGGESQQTAKQGQHDEPPIGLNMKATPAAGARTMGSVRTTVRSVWIRV